MKRSSTKSALAKAKGLGSAGSGSHHWWHIRLTSVFLVILTLWLVTFCWEIGGYRELSSILSVTQKPRNVLMLSLFAILVFYHSFLGMQVVIEDYVNCRALRLFLIVFIQLFSVITASAFVVSAMYIMTL